MTHIQLAEADLGQHLVPYCAVGVPKERWHTDARWIPRG